MVFLAIIVTPMLVFRGSFEDFLNYVQIGATKDNVDNLKGALSYLEENGFISYTLDRTDRNYFVASLLRQKEVDMRLEIGMIRKCKQLSDIHNKRSWVPILKTWMGMQFVYENNKQPFTMEDMKKLTGLSEYQIRESKKILEEDDLFRTSKAYISYDRCIGQNVELNGFYN